MFGLSRRVLATSAFAFGSLFIFGHQYAEAGALDDIKAKGEFAFGLEAQYKPFEFRDENNEIIGYDIDIANALAEKWGVEAKPTDTNWATVIQTLYNGGFDMILGGMTATQERYERVNFSIPYMDASSGILVKADSGIADRAGLDGKVVAAGAGTPQIGQLEVTAEELSISYDGEIKTYDDDAVAYQAMASGRIDAYVSTLVSLSEFTKTTEGFEILPFRSDRWSTEYTAAAFRKEDNDLREAFDTAIREMKADGTLAALQEKWFGRSFVDGLSDYAPTW
jgi:polar amino acid transport system substrate-binding protein